MKESKGSSSQPLGYPPMPGYSQNGGNNALYGYSNTGSVTSSPSHAALHNVVEGIPLYPDANEKTQKFVSQGCKDRWAAVLFAVCSIISLGIGGANLFMGFKNSSNASPKPSGFLGISTGIIIGALFGIVAMSSVLSTVCLSILCQFPQQSIIGANVLSCIIMVVISILSFTQKIVFSGIMFLFFAILNAIMLYVWRSRIPFSAILLKTATSLTMKYKGMIVASFALIGVFTAYCIFWLGMIYPSAYRSSVKQATGGDAMLIIFSMFSFFWTSQVILNVMHVTASGVTATWYFVGDQQMPSNPTLASMKRACTTSFGSVCFGSLLVAILNLIRFIVSSQRNHEQPFIACIVDCIIGCIERLVEYFNHYAYVYVAIYGYGYIDAAKRTFELANNCVFAAMFNDSLVGTTLMMTAIAMSAISFVLFWGVFNLTIGSISFFICLLIHIQIFRIIDSAVTCIFVCFAEEPNALAQCNLELYESIHNANVGAAQV